ncbi:hypothetical protein AKJ09_03044 [Labilithrix luteola]|uniref:Transmembrane protein n=1 Tax=Labilithrix luteola TaxID=1391654 RepID=A0A0K1PS65_9BACT|nr:hypothetical protein [Labilithrix luteola]AKU96380.1 hypothetical protein AKJ09_03044 [Labilithrix luteola]
MSHPHRLSRTWLGRALALTLVVGSVPAWAHDSIDEPCSVVRKCSSTGLDCASTDRSCMDDAVTRGLQVVCERPDEVSTKRFVYCPEGQGGRDSRYVWVLLVMALSLAFGGSAIAYAVLKKKA